MKRVFVNIDGISLELDVEGETFFGSDELMIENDDDLTKNADWHNEGYTIAPFLSEIEYQKIHDGVTKLVKDWVEKEIKKPVPNFSLVKYHEYCEDNDVHLAVVRNFQQCIPVEDFPVDFRLVEKRISEICKVDVQSKHTDLTTLGKFCIRLIRPQRNTDNNPPHRDVYLNSLRNSVNIYVPLAGSNNLSALPLIPKSHFWKESAIERTTAASKVNNVKFSVPCIIGSKHGLNMIRPLPARNEVMVFSPYLIHGGGRNFNTDETRVSLEMRFWRKEKHNKLKYKK